MKPEIKTFEFKVEDADSQKGIIRGFASTFGNIDLGDDIVDSGAFKKTIRETKGIVPILADHDPAKQIGWNMRAEETEAGLFVEGKLNLDGALGKEKYSLIKQALEIGAQMGLSIGYAAIKAIPDKERPSVRRIKEVRLYEYSVVTFPMNTQAMVTAAKSWTAEMDNDAFIQQIIKESKSRGLNPYALIEALQKNEAAKIESDPSELGQSYNKILELLKT